MVTHTDQSIKKEKEKRIVFKKKLKYYVSNNWL